MKKLKEMIEGDELLVKDFLAFYIPEIKSVKVYHNTIDCFDFKLNSFIRLKEVNRIIQFTFKDGVFKVDFKKVQPIGLVTESNSVVFISKDSKITFEFFV
jgi:hypothetical protein